MRCPVTTQGIETAALYVEYIFDTFEETMPGSFYGNAVKQNILTVEIVTIVAFFLCCGMYFLTHVQQERSWKEREAEREKHSLQLSEALQAAQVANSSKTTFLANMSHDIRTPMNAILGFTTLLAKDAENPVKVREYTRKITASGQHLPGLINDVLDISKIESGKVVLTLEEFDLRDMVTAIDAILMDVQMPVVSMTGYGVNVAAEHKEDALALLDGILSDRSLEEYCQISPVISPSKSVEVDCVEPLKPLNDRINEGVYVLGSNANMNVEQWSNICLIVRELLNGSSVDDCMAMFDALQAESLAG